jgi:hypothetical protein
MTQVCRVVASRTAGTRTSLAALCLCAASVGLDGCATTAPPATTAHPSQWATPITATGVPNLYRVNSALYRSAQPTREGIATDPARQPVLVHCRRGADRTGAMVAIYRVVVEGWTKADAIDEMTRGGYGFRPVWQNLVRYIEDLDVKGTRARVVAAR